MDIQKEMCVKQGYVPATCTMPGPMVYALTSSQGDACKGCNDIPRLMDPTWVDPTEMGPTSNN